MIGSPRLDPSLGALRGTIARMGGERRRSARASAVVATVECAVLTVALSWSSPVQAAGPPDEPRIHLEWSRGPGAETCLSPEAAAREVERLLARPVFASSDADRRLVVSIERTREPPGYEAHMSLFSASGAPLGSREIAIEAERCEQATEAFTLALSIMADVPRTPEERAPAAPPPNGARSSRADRDERTPPHVERFERARAAPVSSSETERRPPARLAVGLGPAAAVVTSSAVSPGGHLSVLFEPKGFWPVLGSVLSTMRSHETFEARRAWLSSTRVEAALCLPPLGVKTFALFACVGPQATVHVGWGAGFGEDRSGAATTFGGLARAYARQTIAANLHVFASFSVAATPQALEVAFTDRGGARRTALETAKFSPSLSIGVAFDDYLGTR